MNLITLFVTAIVSLIVCSGYSQQNDLRTRITDFLKDKKASIGVALYNFETGDTLTVGNEKGYPMQSVYKFHLALAVLNLADKGILPLDDNVPVSAADVKPDTWSTLKQKYPKGNPAVPIREIFHYTVSQSDNIGCDILFRMAGGPARVNEYIHDLGIRQVQIKTTEEAMRRAWEVQYINWTTPFAAVELLKKFYNGNILSRESHAFLWQQLVETTTGLKRIKGQLPSKTIVAHKTGTSDVNEQGVTAATNDIGIVMLPNGQPLGVAVFVSDSAEDSETNEKIIAEVSKMAWDYYTKRKD